MEQNKEKFKKDIEAAVKEGMELEFGVVALDYNKMYQFLFGAGYRQVKVCMTCPYREKEYGRMDEGGILNWCEAKRKWVYDTDFCLED